jgi:hypothetical protein
LSVFELVMSVFLFRMVFWGAGFSEEGCLATGREFVPGTPETSNMQMVEVQPNESTMRQAVRHA